MSEVKQLNRNQQQKEKAGQVFKPLYSGTKLSNAEIFEASGNITNFFAVLLEIQTQAREGITKGKGVCHEF